MQAKKKCERAPTRAAARVMPPKAAGEPMTARDLDKYEIDLQKREEETRAPAPITNEETAELLAVASKLRQRGISPLVFLRRALDAQARLVQDPAARAAAASKSWEMEVAAICRLLQEPDAGPDVLFSPRLLERLRELRYGAVQRFSSTKPSPPFDPETEFGLVSLAASYYAETGPLLGRLSRAIAVPGTSRAHTAAKVNADAHQWRVYQWTARTLKAALKKVRATSRIATRASAIEAELGAAKVPQDLRPRLAALALESLKPGESLKMLLAPWLFDLRKGLGYAATQRLERVTIEQETADDDDDERALKYLQGLEKRFAGPK